MMNEMEAELVFQEINKYRSEIKEKDEEINKCKDAIRYLSGIIKEKCDDGSIKLLTNRETRRILCNEFGFDTPISKADIMEFAYRNLDLMIKLVYSAPTVLTNPSTMRWALLNKMGDGHPVSNRKDEKLFRKHYRERSHPIVSDSGEILNKSPEKGGDDLYMTCRYAMTQKQRRIKGVGPAEKLIGFFKKEEAMMKGWCRF